MCNTLQDENSVLKEVLEKTINEVPLSVAGLFIFPPSSKT